MPPQERTVTNDVSSKVFYTEPAVSYPDTRPPFKTLRTAALVTPKNELPVIPSHHHQLAGLFGSSFMAPLPRKKLLLILLVVLLVFLSLFISLYTFNRPFRRNCQFWVTAYPLVLEYKLLKFQATHIHGCKTEKELQVFMKSYHERTAPKVLESIQRMKGIYIKIGQFLSTVGSGILDEEYVKALRPLQDGSPPRSYEAIKQIIEESTGKKMEEIFDYFEEKPIGAASVAQAHRATLRQKQHYGDDSTIGGRKIIRRGGSSSINRAGGGEQVIVKVQYPEVAELFDADMKNLEILTRLLSPQNIDMIKNARKKHEIELDFRLEANNLRECTENMQRHGLEPNVIRIPRVRNETGVCTKHVLVMEYLEGTSLADAIELEQDRIARALGKKDGQELRFTIAQQMKEHFENGGGDDAAGEMKLLGITGGGSGAAQVATKVLQSTGPFAASILRKYAGIKDKMDNFFGRGREEITRTLGGVTVLGPSGGSLDNVEQQFSQHSDSHARKPRKAVAHVNLGRVLKTLIYVHGVQMIQDGLYNADPHPGNVLVLPDGRLGLLDYGMVGRLSEEDRNSIARTVVALAKHDTEETARIYYESDYRVSWKEGAITDADAKILHRLASSHLDKIDMSPLRLECDINDTRKKGCHKNGHNHGVRKVDVRDVLRTLRVHSTPDWILQVRRLGRLLMGVSAQAARPISLAKEWEPIAQVALKAEGQEQKQKKERMSSSKSKR